MARLQTIPKAQKQQQRPKQKSVKFLALIFGVFLISIVSRYSQIYSVYHGNGKLQQGRSVPKSNSKSQRNRAKIGIAPDTEFHSKSDSDVESQETEPPTADEKVDVENTDPDLEEDRPANTTTTKRNSRRKRRNRNKDTDASAGLHNIKIKERKAPKTIDDFREEHLRIKQTFLERMQNVTGETREVVEARADHFFVDLERDPPPKGGDSDSWFVLHIGPPKTATTTIQCGLEKHSLRLAKTDGYHYMGGGCGVDRKEYFMPNGESTVLRRLIVWGLQGAKELSSPVEEFVARAKKIRQSGRSVVLSSELFGSQLVPGATTMKRTRKMLTTSSGFDPENVRIVLSYRHFVDWLPSYHYQKHLMNTVDKPWVINDPDDVRVTPFLQYADEYLSNWEAFQQKALNNSSYQIRKLEEQADDSNEVLDLPFALPKDRQSIHPSWWLYQLWSHYFPLKNQVQVYDMHSPMNSNRPRDDTVTNFICNMLPTANETCSRLMHLEDQKEQQRLIDEQHANGTDTTGTNNNDVGSLDVGAEDEAFDFEDPELYAKPSFLYHNRKKIKQGGNVTGEITIRTSSDHHAAILVEEMLIRGDIRPFDYARFNEAFFATYEGSFRDAEGKNDDEERVVHGDNEDDVQVEFGKPLHNGKKKAFFVKAAERLFDEHDVRPPNQKYFDCMPEDLEERFLNASLTFMDLIYKNTQMLSLAAEASSATSGSAPETIKEERFEHARIQHARIFEQNKAKGKYCDISLDKIKKEIPSMFKELVSYSFKPKFRKFSYDELPDNMRLHVESLNITSKEWDQIGNSLGQRPLQKLWNRGGPRQKEAIFALYL